MGEIVLRFLKIAALLVAMVAATGAGTYDSAISLSVIRTDPGFTATLSSNETVYMAVAYESGQPIRIQARAYRQGKSVDKGQMMNATALHPAGSGRALVWVAFQNAAKVDQIEITAYNDNWDVVSQKTLGADLTWTSTGASAFPDPQWVSDMRRAERKLIAQYDAASGSGFRDILLKALSLLIFAAVPGYILLQAVALARFSGRWRFAAMAPLLLMGAAGVHAAFALSAGSNIWPILVVLAAPFAVLYLGGLFSMQFFRTGKA
jgi:hypothetical protein